jgi:hypothetical protein
MPGNNKYAPPPQQPIQSTPQKSQFLFHTLSALSSSSPSVASASPQGWSYRCYRLDKYLPHHAPATEEKRAAKRAAQTSGKHEASGEAEEWVGATTALERKVARVLRKAGKGAVVFRTRTKPTGFFNGLLDHATEVRVPFVTCMRMR